MHIKLILGQGDVYSDASSVERRLPPFQRTAEARWQSGYAADCNSVYAGSIPTLAFSEGHARVAELVDAADLKSAERKFVPVRVRPWAPRLRPKAAVLRRADSPLWWPKKPSGFPETDAQLPAFRLPKYFAG